jgi:hypothetical protein
MDIDLDSILNDALDQLESLDKIDQSISISSNTEIKNFDIKSTSFNNKSNQESNIKSQDSILESNHSFNNLEDSLLKFQENEDYTTEKATNEDDVKIPTAHNKVERLLATNVKVMESLNQALEQAKLANDEGNVNFLGGRLEIHAKHGWMLRSITKKQRA